MLVITRRESEWLDIGPDIQIQIVEVKGDRCRIGIVAPKSVPVHRRELTLRIRGEMTEDESAELGGEG